MSDDLVEDAIDETVDAPGAATASGAVADTDDATTTDEPTTGDPTEGGSDTITEEAVVALIAERDEYLDALQRLKAEFANARRRADEQAAARRSQAAADLVEKLLPVLDSCDAALAQGIEEVRPIGDALFDVLSGQGLQRVDAVGEPFDPEVHEAVIYEEGGDGAQVVIETLRTGYRWNERVLRAPMVKVQG
jgi:molecular chaperone GrpE